jgi:hypothetical protein
MGNDDLGERVAVLEARQNHLEKGRVDDFQALRALIIAETTAREKANEARQRWEWTILGAVIVAAIGVITKRLGL